MADAKIEITAEAGQAKATLEELRKIAADAFTGIEVSAEKATEAQEALAQEWSKLGVTATQAKEAATQLRPQIEQTAQAGGNAADIMKGLRGELFGIYSTTQLVTSNLRDLQAGLEPLIAEVQKFAVSAGASQQAVDLFSNSVEMLVKPTTIAKNLIENFKIAWDAFKEGAGLSTEATVKFSEEMGRAADELQKLRDETAADAQGLAARATAISVQVNAERSRGEVTEATRKAVADLVGEYEKSDQTVPPKLMRAAALVGVLTSAQEDAAKAAEKAGTEAEKAADKQEKAAAKAQEALDKKAASLAAETAELEKQFSAESQLIPKLTEFAEGKKAGTAAVDDSVRALKEELTILEQAAKAAEDAAKSAGARASQAAGRIAELEGKPVLTIEEQNELNDLKSAQVDIDNEAADAADNAAQATFEYGAAQAELGESTDKASESLDYSASVMAELEAATSGYQAALAGVGDEAQSTTAYVEAVGEDGTKFWTNFTDTVVGGNEALGDTGAALGDIADTLPDTADGLYEVGDALKNLDAPTGDGEDKGIGKIATDAKTLTKELLPEMLRLIKEIKAEAAGITLGGGDGAGI